MSHHDNAHEVRNPGTLNISDKSRIFLILFALAGGIVFFAALSVDPKRAWAAFLMNHFYFMSFAIGGLFFAATQWVTGAMWSAPVRRIAEAFTSYLPFAIVSFVVLSFGIHTLYHWSHPEAVAADHILKGKSGYLNTAFFVGRNIFALVLWILFAKKMVGNSLTQDSTKDPKLTASNKSWSPMFLFLFALTFTMAAFDQLMSLDPHWFSTMFGVYCFAGLFYSTLALICVFTIILKRRGLLEGIANENHLHDLGKFMFAFTVFWAYIGFSQFMLIWYANLPEETGYFIKRFSPAWMPVSIFLLIGKFMTPFFLLLPRDSKRSESVLLPVAIFMLVAQWIDVLWMVQPEVLSSGPRFTWIELGVTLGFVGVFGLFVTRFLSRNSVVAIGDPRLAESVFHHHQ